MNISYSIYEHGNLQIWERMTRMHFLSVLDKKLQDYRMYIDEYYNEYIEPFDYNSNSYRKFIIGYKESMPIEIEKFKFSNIPENSYKKLKELENEFNILFYNKMIKREEHDIVTILKDFIGEKEQSILSSFENLKLHNIKDYLQIYTRNKEDYSSEQSITIEFEQNDSVIYKEIDYVKDLQGIRIDPSINNCMIKILSLKGLLENGDVIDFTNDIKTNGEKNLEDNIYI
jgi:hypothetical protein